MKYELDQFRSGVDQATGLVTELVLAKRGQSGGTQQAIRKVAHDCRVSPATVRKYFQPSRRPKDIPLGVWQRLWHGYRCHIERQLAQLETDLARIEALGGAGDSAGQHLVDEAEALVSRIKTHL